MLYEILPVYLQHERRYRPQKKISSLLNKSSRVKAKNLWHLSFKRATRESLLSLGYINNGAWNSFDGGATGWPPIQFLLLPLASYRSQRLRKTVSRSDHSRSSELCTFASFWFSQNGTSGWFVIQFMMLHHSLIEQTKLKVASQQEKRAAVCFFVFWGRGQLWEHRNRSILLLNLKQLRASCLCVRARMRVCACVCAGACVTACV